VVDYPNATRLSLVLPSIDTFNNSTITEVLSHYHLFEIYHGMMRIMTLVISISMIVPIPTAKILILLLGVDNKTRGCQSPSYQSPASMDSPLEIVKYLLYQTYLTTIYNPMHRHHHHYHHRPMQTHTITTTTTHTQLTKRNEAIAPTITILKIIRYNGSVILHVNSNSMDLGVIPTKNFHGYKIFKRR